MIVPQWQRIPLRGIAGAIAGFFGLSSVLSLAVDSTPVFVGLAPTKPAPANASMQADYLEVLDGHYLPGSFVSGEDLR
jgi:hypothetical protein